MSYPQTIALHKHELANVGRTAIRKFIAAKSAPYTPPDSAAGLLEAVTSFENSDEAQERLADLIVASMFAHGKVSQPFIDELSKISVAEGWPALDNSQDIPADHPANGLLDAVVKAVEARVQEIQVQRSDKTQASRLARDNAQHRKSPNGAIRS